jgi:hypothetical protein
MTKLSVTDPSANIDDAAPKPTAADTVHAVVKGAIAAIPLVGGGGSELFSLIFAPPLSNRKDEWMETIAEGLKNLQGQVDGFDIENLKDDPTFITTLANASQIAVRSHQAEKLRALRNAVLNSALHNAPDDDLQAIFLNCIDTFTEWHLRILKFLDNPQEWLDQNGIPTPDIYMGATSTVMDTAFQELKGKGKFSDLIVKELYAKGLLGVDSLHTMMSFSGVMAQRTTSFGKQFLDFISEPL